MSENKTIYAIDIIINTDTPKTFDLNVRGMRGELRGVDIYKRTNLQCDFTHVIGDTTLFVNVEDQINGLHNIRYEITHKGKALFNREIVTDECVLFFAHATNDKIFEPRKRKIIYES